LFFRKGDNYLQNKWLSPTGRQYRESIATT